MGLDYIRARTGKPWRKRWDRGLDRLKAPTLLDLTMSEAARLVTAEVNPAARAKAGDTCIIQITHEGLTLSDGLQAIGLIRNPPPEMMAAVRNCGGYAEGKLQRVGLFGRHGGGQRQVNIGPPHEPKRQFKEPKKLWDDPSRQEQSLGCPTCLERHRCGGVHTDAGVVDCRDLCICADKRKCDMVCRFNPSLFVARMREVGGLDFHNAPRTRANGVPAMPAVIPFVDHRYGRVAMLDEPVVALSLYDLIDFTTGKLQVTSRSQLAARFLIREDAEVIVSGVGKDRPIERWWNSKDRVSLMASLNELGITLVTTPNYSVLTDVPRTDNLHAMKRILLTWTEMASTGLATALHVNARTEHDYRRWSDLIGERPEVEVLAFEFASGCGWGERIDWHVTQLCGLADRVERPLAMIIRGGGRKLVKMRQHYAQVILVETESFARTIRRRRAYLSQTGRLEVGELPNAGGRAGRRTARTQCQSCPPFVRATHAWGESLTTAAAQVPTHSAL